MAASSSSSASTHEHLHHHLPAPPPTPSSNLATSSPEPANALSSLLHRLPPTLSLPTRRLAPPPAACLPPISFSNTDQLEHLILFASSHHGFFQLTNHDIPSQLASSAGSESLCLFALSKEQKQASFPKNWPLGFTDEDENDPSFWFDGAITCNSGTNDLSGLSLSSLRGLSLALEKLGLEVVEMVSRAAGFDNPFKEDPTRVCSMMVVHECSGGNTSNNDGAADAGLSDPGGFYPCVVGLQYQIRSQKYSMLSDSGWATILPEVDSVLVTIGDIAQVWSNGKLKKVRGRPVPCLGDGNNNNSHCVLMTLLITLPLDSTVSPLLPKPEIGEATDESDPREDGEGQKSINGSIVKDEKRVFSSFSFEDYAWRVYNEPFLLKDPLKRYRI